MKRLIEQTLCEKCERFHEGERIVDAGCFGSGGSSREVTVDYFAATRKHRELCTKSGWPTVNGIKKIVNAALGGGR